MKCGNLCSAKNVHLLMIFSVAALILSGLVSVFGMDIWLAGTQWILVSIVLAVYAVVLSVHENYDGSCGCDDSCNCDCASEDVDEDEERE